MRVPLVIAAFVLVLSPLSSAQQSVSSCASSAQCAQMANDAITREEYEQAHDLAWRAMQLGPRNDTTLMYLLARAQSLSGRPHDSLIMLQRLAAMGVHPADVNTSEEFRRVRGLREWTASTDAVEPATTPAAARAATEIAPPASAPRRASTALLIPAEPTPIALAYDAVSRRFVFADERGEILKIVDETSGHVVNLVSREWAGPYRTTAVAIDPRRGDLWVAGVHRAGADEASRSALHRLQLVSGRWLQTIALANDAGAARFVDLTIARDQVWALDAIGGRVFSVGPRESSLRLAATIENVEGATSVTAAGGNNLYLSHAAGLVRVNLGSGSSVAVRAAKGVDLTNLQKILWRNGVLFGIQTKADGTFAAVRIRLDASGRRATAVAVLDRAAGRAADLAGDVFHYVSVQFDADRVMLRHIRAQ